MFVSVGQSLVIRFAITTQLVACIAQQSQVVVGGFDVVQILQVTTNGCHPLVARMK